MARFRATSAGPSTGQDFRRQGKSGNTYATVAAELSAMSNRLMFAGKNIAEEACDIMEDEVVKYVDPNNDPGFTYSEGRLAATIGTWKPELIKDPDVLLQAEQWAMKAGVSQPEQNTNDAHDTFDYGAYRSIRHYKGNMYSAEMGTFTPYAALVEDGGSMPIHPYGDLNVTITARWEAHRMFAKGLFDSFDQIEKSMEKNVKDAL